MASLIKNITIFLPETVLTNRDLAIEFNVSEDHIFKSVGIKTRHISGPDELASEMGIKAVENLFNEGEINKQDIDFLIFCSTCFDYSAPTTSCILQDRLGLSKQIACLDLPYGCSGFIYGLAMAKSFIKSGMAKNILFITSDNLTKTVPKNNLELRSIFSDAASATLITQSNFDNLGEFVFGTDGSGALDVFISGSGFRDRVKASFLNEEKLPNGKFEMDGMKVFNFGLRVVPQLINDILEKNKMDFNEIDMFIFHQPSRFLLDVLKKKMNIPDHKFFINIEDRGNTSSTSIPLALVDAKIQGKIHSGMTLLVAGFGVGYSWAGTIIKI